MLTDYETRTGTRTPTYLRSYSPARDIDDDEETSRFSMPSYNSVSTTTDTEPAFEIEQNYNTNDYEEEEPYKVVRASMQQVERKQAQVLQVNSAKPKLSARLKIMLTVYSLIMVLLIGFAIYNAVSISSLSANVAAKQTEVYSSQQVINGLETQYNVLGTDEVIYNQVAGEFVEANGSNTVVISRPTLDAGTTYEAPTNWFDKICEFFSSLF